MARRGNHRRPWWASCQWSVYALFPDRGPGHPSKPGWNEIYCVETKKLAHERAAEWAAKTGQRVEVRPGEGHKSRRAA